MVCIYDYSHVWQISLLILLVEISDILIVIIWHVVSKFVYVAAKDCMGVWIAVAFYFPASVEECVAALCSHTFLYRGWEVKSHGNPYTHAILRGYVDKFGNNMPNYHYEDIRNLYEQYQKRNLPNMGVIVDTNHSNSGKQYEEQIRISKDVMRSCHVSPDLHKFVKGLMIESYLEDDSQKVEEHCYGKSITDPCLGWDKTEKLIYDLADLW